MLTADSSNSPNNVNNFLTLCSSFLQHHHHHHQPDLTASAEHFAAFQAAAAAASSAAVANAVANAGLQNRKADALCLVCGDKASGKHYGVISVCSFFPIHLSFHLVLLFYFSV